MKSTRTSPGYILALWEECYGTLSSKYRMDFKEHKVTQKLSQFQVIDIKTAMHHGKKKYLSDILKYIETDLQKSRQSLKQVAGRERGNSSKETSREVKGSGVYLCSKWQVHSGADVCRCAVAA